MEQNFTPLDSSFNIPSFQPEPPSPPPNRKKIQLDTIYLISAASIFVLSLGLLINSSRLTTTSEAKSIPLITSVPKQNNVGKNLPKTFKNESIPLSIYENLSNYPDVPSDGRDEYVKMQVMKFYIYKDLLQQNNSSNAAVLIPKTYKDIKDGVNAMEPIIKQNLLSRAYFGYIKATFANGTGEEALQKKYGNLKTKAETVIKRYQQMFVEGDFSAQQIIDVSNKDEELLLLNNREKSEFVDDYDSTQKIFLDKGFNDFLFSQQENQLSDLYTLHDEKDTPVAYIIVYASKILKKKYNSLEQIIEENSGNFLF